MQSLSRLLAALLLAVAPLTLPALSSVDGRIELAARESYNFRLVLEGRVRIKVHQGQATLYGYVTDATDRVLAQDTVENLPEVTGITNNISVAPRYLAHSDSWMTATIRRRLLVQANVNATTTVSVHQGVATLAGTAPGDAQRELAGLYAGSVDRVKSVTNKITVTGIPAPAERLDDASVTALVRAILRDHQSTGALKTGITTTDGVVRVTGEATSEAVKSLVTQLARNTRGATSVINDMAVKG